jgi:hypothetical protein
MTAAFDKLMNGLSEVETYLHGNTKGHKTTLPGEVDVKAVRKRLGLTQASSPSRSVSASTT